MTPRVPSNFPRGRLCPGANLRGGPRFSRWHHRACENIANPIDVNLQADLPHLVNKKLTAAQLLIEKPAASPSRDRRSRSGDGIEVAQQAAFVDGNLL